MGEAKTIIGSSESDRPYNNDTVLGQLDTVLDDIDSALQVKLVDLYGEGAEKRTENHYKIGLMRGADTLIRRAKAMLEDCYESLDLTSSEEDDDAADA